MAAVYCRESSSSSMQRNTKISQFIMLLRLHRRLVYASREVQKEEKCQGKLSLMYHAAVATP